MAANSLSRARLVRRATRIAWLVGKHWVRFWIGFVLLFVRFSGKARRRDWFGQVVLDLFRDLGATFIKLGQIMSTRPDLIPEFVSKKLQQLQDDVGPFPLAAVTRSIEHDLGAPVAKLFPEFAPVPLASASVSQVHKARLPDGRLVAVKVRRPDVVELCTFDLAVMRLGARVLNAIPSISTLAPIATVDEFGRAIFSQLDFRVEARNNRRFRENFREEAMVVFPEVIEGLSSERILTMTFIEGTKILSTKQTRSDPKRVARLGLRVLLKMIFEDGFVHADLHPGNILITPEDKLALLDLGLVGELDGPHRRGFTKFFAAWAQRDGDTMARLMYEMSANAHERAAGQGPADPEAFERYRAAIIEFVGRYWGQRLGEVQVGKVLFDMLGILRRHRVRVNPTFTIVNIAIAVTEGIGKQLDPELDLMAEALPYFLAHPQDLGTASSG
ncbi:MAG TPA: AarF/UbiB family protein [Polyangia bacterium]|jgi:ubiquinone biosynthesis protein|nr:AarF/UbiB family protein [Polyangia bacterium]